MMYPPRPEPIRVEIEPTNFCNAKCVFCPRQKMSRQKGYLDLEKFSDFLDRLDKYRQTMWINEQCGGLNLPRLVFGGCGEPTLHPQIARLVSEGRVRGFETELVTNGSLLNPDLVSRLTSAGLDRLAISLHSLNPRLFSRLTGLDLGRVLPRVMGALNALDSTDVNIEIWRVGPPIGSIMESGKADQDRFMKFLAGFRKNIKILGPTPAWNRGGQFSNTCWPKVCDSAEVWCHLLYFTLNISWDGTSVICCCDYPRLTVPLGNAWLETIETLQNRRYEVFKVSFREQLCKECRRPKDRTYEVVLRRLRNNML